MNSQPALSTQYEEHLDAMAAQIWRSIVSEHLSDVPHYKHWVISKPAKQIGGDFHLASDEFVFVGDVSGKGIPAALFTGMFVSTLKLAAQMKDPGKALELALFDALERSEKFATLAALKMGADGWMIYLTLGHPPILVKQGSEVLLLKTNEPPLGVVRKSRYLARPFHLEPGDWVCIYTDGLIDAEKDCGGTMTQFGLQRLQQLMQDSASPEDFFSAIGHVLEEWTLTDDLTTVVLQYQPDDSWISDRLERR